MEYARFLERVERPVDGYSIMVDMQMALNVSVRKRMMIL